MVVEESDLFGGKLELAELLQTHDSLKGYLGRSHNDTARHPRKPPGLFWKPILQESTSLKTNMAGKSPFSNTRYIFKLLGFPLSFVSFRGCRILFITKTLIGFHQILSEASTVCVPGRLGLVIVLLLMDQKSGINSPVEVKVVEIPLFTRFFQKHPNGGWEWDF